MRQRSCEVAASHVWLSTIAGLALVLLTASVQSAYAETPSGSSSPSCPSAVTITALAIQKQLDGGRAVVDISHDAQGCPDATPATLHVHQNLVPSPQAGSDPAHQSNVDIAVGANFGSSASFDLLTAVPGECFVQFDASAGNIRRGRFFATTTCPAASSSPPASSSGPPAVSSSASISSGGSSAISSPPSRRPRTSHGVAEVATSRTPHLSNGPLAMTGAHPRELTGAAALLLGFGTMLCYAARRPRRH